MIRSTNWVNIPHYEIRKWIKSTSDKVKTFRAQRTSPEDFDHDPCQKFHLPPVHQHFYRNLKRNLKWKNQQSKMKSFATVEKGDEHKMQPCRFLNLDSGTYLIDGLN